MKNKLSSFVSKTPSKWLEDANNRSKNRGRLYKSAMIATKILQVIRAKGLMQTDLARELNISPQQVSKIVQGKENLTLDTIDKLESVLGIELITVPKYSALTEMSVASFRDFVQQPKIESSLTVTKKSQFVERWFIPPCNIYSLDEGLYQRTGTDG